MHENRFTKKKGELIELYYYTTWLLTAFMAVVTIVTLILHLAGKIRVKPILIVLFAVLTIIDAANAKDSNLLKNFGLYNNIVSSDQITAYYGDEAEPVVCDFSPAREGLYLLEHLEDAPVYADKEDIESVCWIKFERTDEKFSEMVQLCELKKPGAYPYHVYFSYGGKYYCFLSGRFLYKNAFYCLPRERAEEALRLLIETPA